MWNHETRYEEFRGRWIRLIASFLHDERVKSVKSKVGSRVSIHNSAGVNRNKTMLLAETTIILDVCLKGSGMPIRWSSKY